MSFTISSSATLTTFTAGAHLHVIGVCGVAMAQLAVVLSELGFKVSGSDAEFYEPMGSFLRRSQVELYSGYKAENISADTALVVIGNAVSVSNPEVIESERRCLPYTIFPKLLHETVISGCHSIVVTGTHGKTTTAAMTAFILAKAGRMPGYFIGGIARDFERSLMRGAGAVSVVEGDEYDSAFFCKVPKFTFYSPNTMIINAIEYDHADIYPNLEAIEAQFSSMVQQLPAEAQVICNSDYSNMQRLLSQWKGTAKCSFLTFGESVESDLRLVEVREEAGVQRGLVRSPAATEISVELKIPGKFNLLNALAAMSAAQRVGVSFEDSAAALREFQGVRRRQEVISDVRGITLIEDFAHHPTAVRETLAGIRARYPQRRLVAVFEPRSATSRRKVFHEQYKQALKLADVVVLSLVQARTVDQGAELLHVPELAAELKREGTECSSFAGADAIFDSLSTKLRAGDVVVVMSNGSFGGLIQKLASWLAA